MTTSNHMISRAIGINQLESIFQKPVGKKQFVVFERFTDADLFQIAREKICDHKLMISDARKKMTVFHMSCL